MLGASPLLDLVRAGAFVMLMFAAILIWVAIRNLEAPIRFGTRTGPVMVGIGLVLLALPIYGDIAGASLIARPGSVFRIVAAIVLPIGLYLMKPLTEASELEASEDEEAEGS